MPYTHSAHRAGKRNIRDTESRRSSHNTQNIGIVLLIDRKHRNYNLHIVTITLREKRTQGTVSKAAGQDSMFCSSALAFNKPAWNFTGGIHTFFYIYS